MGEHFEETKTAWARLKRAFHLWRIGHHVVATARHLERLGPEGEKARLSIINAYLFDVPETSSRA